jgi:uncharacterized membrane protein YsdA (DUF1294 family)
MVAAVLAVGYGLVVNILAFALFGIDKRRAVAGGWRIREATLIGVALMGGWLGAKAGQRRFRHKTRKQPFARRLNAAGVLQVGVLIVAAALAQTPPAAIGPAADSVNEAFRRVVGALADDVSKAEAASLAPTMPSRFGPGSGDGLQPR